MTSSRKIIHHSADYWQSHLDNWQQGSLTQRQYCQQNNLGLSTFQKWKKKLYPSLVSSKQLSEPFIEIPAHSLEPQPVTQWDIELELGNNITLRLRQS